MIMPGSILIDGEAVHPPFFELEDWGSPNAWMTVKHKLTSQELDAQLSASGWTFFYIANQITTTGFGFNRTKALHSALKRIIANVCQRRCNCLEIDDVETYSFMGIRYVRISAHPRHIQKGILCDGGSTGRSGFSRAGNAEATS